MELPQNTQKDQENTPSRLDILKRRTKKTAAILTLGATAFGFVRGAQAISNNEGFEEWNKGPELSVIADKGSEVVGHEIVHSHVSTLFDQPSYKINIKQCDDSGEAEVCNTDWVTVSPDEYKEVEVGDRVIVEKHKADWSDELQDKRTYSIEIVEE